MLYLLLAALCGEAKEVWSCWRKDDVTGGGFCEINNFAILSWLSLYPLFCEM